MKKTIYGIYESEEAINTLQSLNQEKTTLNDIEEYLRESLKCPCKSFQSTIIFADLIATLKGNPTVTPPIEFDLWIDFNNPHICVSKDLVRLAIRSIKQIILCDAIVSIMAPKGYIGWFNQVIYLLNRLKAQSEDIDEVIGNSKKRIMRFIVNN